MAAAGPASAAQHIPLPHFLPVQFCLHSLGNGLGPNQALHLPHGQVFMAHHQAFRVSTLAPLATTLRPSTPGECSGRIAAQRSGQRPRVAAGPAGAAECRALAAARRHFHGCPVHHDSLCSSAALSEAQGPCLHQNRQQEEQQLSVTSGQGEGACCKAPFGN